MARKNLDDVRNDSNEKDVVLNGLLVQEIG